MNRKSKRMLEAEARKRGMLPVFRDYQREHMHEKILPELRTGSRSIAVLYGVGGGKTYIAAATIAITKSEGLFTHIIYMAPQTGIRAQTANDYSHRPFRYEGKTYTVPEIRECSGRSFRNNFLGVSTPNYVAAVTNDVIRRYTRDIRDAIEKGRLVAGQVFLVIDETHHVSEGEQDEEGHPLSNQQSVAVDDLCDLGIRTMRLTGTAFRSDKRRVVRDELCVEYSLTALMLGGYAPSDISVKFVFFDVAHPDEDGAEILACAEAMAKELVSDKMTPTVVRIKHRSSDDNKLSIEEYTAGFQRVGADVISVYLDSGNEDLREALRREHRYPCYGELVKVYMGIHKITEGIDPPSRCNLYLAGVPRSLSTLQQSIGRIMRNRVDAKGTPLFKGYPVDRLNKSRVVLFVARGSDSDLHCSKAVLQAALYLNSFQDASLLKGLLNVRDGFSLDRQAQDFAHELFPTKEEDVQADRLVSESLSFWTENGSSLDQPLSREDMLKLARLWAESANEDFNEEALRHAVDRARLKSCLHDPRVHDALNRAIDEAMNGGPLDTVVARALDKVYREDFAKCIQVTGEGALVHSLSGDLIPYLANRVRRIIDQQEETRPSDVKTILRGVHAFLKGRGRFPDARNKDDFDPHNSGWSFLDYDRCLRRGEGGLPKLEGGLAQLVQEHYAAQRPWQKAGGDVLDELRMCQSSDDPKVLGRVSGSRTEALRRIGGHVPEVAYYLDAVLALDRYKFAAQLTLQQATKLGRQPQHRMDSLFAKGGVEAVLQALEG